MKPFIYQSTMLAIVFLLQGKGDCLYCMFDVENMALNMNQYRNYLGMGHNAFQPTGMLFTDTVNTFESWTSYLSDALSRVPVAKECVMERLDFIHRTVTESPIREIVEND